MSDLLWRLHPNGKQEAGVSITREVYARIEERAWLSVNGHVADIRGVEEWEDHGRVRLRVTFRESYPDPHP